MESIAMENNRCCHKQPPPPPPPPTTTAVVSGGLNDRTCNIKSSNSNEDGSCNGGSQLSTKVTATNSDTVEVTVTNSSTLPNNPLHEISFSSSLTSHHNVISFDTIPEYVVNDDNTEETLDGPIPDEIPRFIYYCTRRTNSSSNTSTTSNNNNNNNNNEPKMSVEPIVSKSIFRRFFIHRWHLRIRHRYNHINSNNNSMYGANTNDGNTKTHIPPLFIWNHDDSEYSDLVCGGMTLVSL
jgi:hypothetical protein